MRGEEEAERGDKQQLIYYHPHYLDQTECISSSTIIFERCIYVSFGRAFHQKQHTLKGGLSTHAEVGCTSGSSSSIYCRHKRDRLCCLSKWWHTLDHPPFQVLAFDQREVCHINQLLDVQFLIRFVRPLALIINNSMRTRIVVQFLAGKRCNICGVLVFQKGKITRTKARAVCAISGSSC